MTATATIALITRFMGFAPSPLQNNVLTFLVDETGSAIVEAVAGSGKTKTIEMALLAIPEGKAVTLIAFSKIIADELNARIAGLRKLTGRAFANASASTFHALALRALNSKLRRRAKIDGRKINTLIREHFSADDQELYGAFCSKLVGYARGEGFGAIDNKDSDPEAWRGLIIHHDLYLDSEESSEDYAIELAQKLLKISNDVAINGGVIDFDDMLYLAVKLNCYFAPQDFVFVDEAQDTNPVRRAILRKLVNRNGGRLIAVGDPRQAIFGFTGASHDSLELIARDFHAKTLPLSVCYRCAASIVRHAAEIVPHITAAPNAPEGKAGVALPGIDDLLKLFTARDAILCRNTAPLVSLAYAIIARGKGCRILGRDIGAGLVKLVKAQKAKNLASLESKLAAWIDRAAKAGNDDDSKLAGLRDRVDCIRTIVENLPGNAGIADLIRQIESMFTDDDKSPLLTLATIHKAKGKEYPRVALLRPELLPSKFARQPWQQQQEMNLDYVWRTRAQQESYYLAA